MNILKSVHEWIVNQNIENDIVIDLTCGNGHDTEFLANHAKKVIAVDIQDQAIQTTKARLSHKTNVEYIHMNHADIDFKKLMPLHGAIYNLGYLPHGDKSLITKTETTLQSLNNLLPTLSRFLVITCYPGHAGGDEEALAVKKWIASHDLEATVYSYNTPTSPIAYCIQI